MTHSSYTYLTSKKITAFIPELGSTVRVLGDWTFTIQDEHRNHDLLRADGKMTMVVQHSYTYDTGTTGEKAPSPRLVEHSTLDGKSYRRTLPRGTEVVIDRIYTRKDVSDFSSVSLVITYTTDANLVALGARHRPFAKKGSPKTYGRFWVNLEDFNSAFLEVVVV